MIFSSPGYETGLAGLATDFGIPVLEESEEAAAEPAGDAGEGARAAGAGAAAETATETATETAAETAPAPEAVPEAAPTPAPASGTADPAPAPAAGTPTAGALAAVPAQTRGRGPRTTRKKVTLPKAAGKSLAENETWSRARLFPVPSLKSDREREVRATSVLLSVMAQVPEFGRRLTAGFGAPAGRMQTFTEVSLAHGDTPRRPDGVIRVERAGKLWTALVETKTNGNPLKAEQVQAYMDIAARRGYEAVITLSNDVALEGRAMLEVRWTAGASTRSASGTCPGPRWPTRRRC